MKSVRIRSFSGPYFPAFALNTERYGIFPCSIQIWENIDQKNSEYGHLYAAAGTRTVVIMDTIIWHQLFAA